MLDREVEHNAAADRAAHGDGAIEFQSAAERNDHFGVAGRGEAIVLVLPSLRRQRLAMPRHVERQHPKMLRHTLIHHQVAELPPVGARGVQADKRNPLP
jgi:hypothetical protein